MDEIMVLEKVHQKQSYSICTSIDSLIQNMKSVSIQDGCHCSCTKMQVYTDFR